MPDLESEELKRAKIPHNQENDYSREAAEVRMDFVREQAGVDPHHLCGYSFDPATLPGNIENFIGAAQVPIGLAGPLLVNGEHAQGEFFVTGLATQRECLEMFDCYGTGKVKKLAEIIAATVLCGDLSLGWAVAVDEWVSAHDRLGRNRPD